MNQTNSASQPATERVTAPATNWVLPRNMQVERVGNNVSPQVKAFPEVRGGICEFCGVVDANYPSEFQYKLCEHYRGMQLQCSYCPDTASPNEVIKNSTLRVLQHPTIPNTLLVHCNAFDCLRKNEQKWKTAV